MGAPQGRSDESAENHVLAAKFSCNPNQRGRGATEGEEKCSHFKKVGHKAEGCWWLHPHLRPAGWVDRGEGSKKGESNRKGFFLAKRRRAEER
jgi:hypothetical protein